MSNSKTQQTDLVTGGAGFIGRTLVDELTARGHRVVVLDNLSLRPGREAPNLPPGAKLATGDIRDGAVVQSILERERPQTVYHLAAIHYIPLCDADPAACVSVNTAGAAAVLQACARLDAAPVCVMASTGAVYAPAETALREDDRLAPVDIYGLSKLWLEQLAELYAKRDGLRVSVARVFNVYGPGETNPHLIPSLVDQALTGSVIQVGNLTTRRDYVHVRDVANALVAIADASRESSLKPINIGSGRAVSGREVVDTIALCMDTKLKTATDARRLRAVDRPLLLSDTRRASDLLGWRAQVAFEDGIRDLMRASVAAGTRV
jgi:UDP-glucose 4-epimerase